MNQLLDSFFYARIKFAARIFTSNDNSSNLEYWILSSIRTVRNISAKLSAIALISLLRRC
ncbi:hypothetical protein DERF_006432 [Dermatophagoides farinae]|uniref:Uncharacterized protein n=1 Tax=Dermatophagoides farinae TaxID=6954 RepID=A0A922L749_DERFA|nr:hypothetical protein DERF_006432 [Dermatophagoides farinae]